MSLDVKTLEALKPRGKIYRLTDKDGLQVEVAETGAKRWFYRYQLGGKRHVLPIGRFPEVGLREARQRAADARRLVKQGIDPLKERDATKAAAKAAAEAEAAKVAQRRTFAEVAATYIASIAPGFTHPKSAPDWRASLRDHAALLADMDVADITHKEVAATLAPIWLAKPERAKKVLQRIGAVLQFAAFHGWRDASNPADAKALRLAGLPPRPSGSNWPSLRWHDVPAFLKALDKRRQSASSLCLRFVVLAGLRSAEGRAVRWSWINWEGEVPVLTIPGRAMKGASARDHRLPLSGPHVDVLRRAWALAGGGEAFPPRHDALVFCNTRGAMLSDMALSQLVRGMNEPEAVWVDGSGRPVVVHGFRASFSTWVDDTRPHEREAAEKALAHQVANKVSAAYRRSDLLDRRVPLMAAWAAHCAA